MTNDRCAPDRAGNRVNPDEFHSNRWLAELDARPRTSVDLAFWHEHRARPRGGRELIPELSDDYLRELQRCTQFPGLKAALWRELRNRRRRSWRTRLALALRRKRVRPV